MRIKRTISCILVAVLFVGIWSIGPGYADDYDRTKLNQLNSQIKDAKKELKEGKAEESKLRSQIKNLDKLMAEAEAEIKSLQSSISATSAKIGEAQKELDAKQAEMDLQSEEMGLRLRAMYKNGEVGMLEVLLGSESVTDFMTNLDMVQKILDNDVHVLEEIESQHAKIEEYKKTLDDLKVKLERQKAEESGRKAELASSRSDVDELRQEVAAENKDLEKELDAMNAEANAITAEILRLQGGGAYVGGILQWPMPASTRITSEFGNRVHPITGTKKLHTGLDIGVATGNAVVAANSGTVIKAAWNNSYGYMVMIDHGGGIVTLYAHNSQLLVKTGQQVARGEKIALSGNTGTSTGPHLHFEVRVNGEYQNPRNYL